MKRIFHITTVLVTSLLMTVTGCSKQPKFTTGDYVMPVDKSAPQDVIKVVGSDDEHYTIFKHYLVEGKLTQIEEYKTCDRKQFENNHIKVERPQVNGSFSPDKFLSE